MKSVRAFIALELSGEIQDELAEIQNQLKKSAADVKWVNPGGIHLTLKFLGSVSMELLEEIKKLLARIAARHKRFQMQLSGLGAFPKIEHPRVIWVGIGQGSEQAAMLARDLEEGLLTFGFLKEKRSFQCHLTLGRVRSAHNRNQLKELLQSVSVQPKNMQVQSLILFQSTLTPKGALYQPLYTAELA